MERRWIYAVLTAVVLIVLGLFSAGAGTFRGGAPGDCAPTRWPVAAASRAPPAAAAPRRVHWPRRGVVTARHRIPRRDDAHNEFVVKYL